MQLARVEEFNCQGQVYCAMLPISFDVSKSPPPPCAHMYRAVLACSNDGSGHLCSSFCCPHRSEHLAGRLLIQKDKNSPQTQVSDSWIDVSDCLHSTRQLVLLLCTFPFYCSSFYSSLSLSFSLSLHLSPFSPSLSFTAPLLSLPSFFRSPPLSFLSSLPLSYLQESH